MGKLILLLGGARSGKSSYAEKLAHQQDGQVAYIATAEALDNEMVSRIKNHKKARPSQWITYEISTSVGDTFRQYVEQTDLVILDCLTMLVSNLLIHPVDDEQDIDEQEATRVINREITELITLIKDNQATWIVVTNEVGLGLVPPYPLGRVYRDQLGWVNQQFAAVAEEVYFMVAGIPVPIDQFRK
jgi:adenosylcobinamide kinase/adenosylcobinamide-phosphate guanylyltransferase